MVRLMHPMRLMLEWGVRRQRERKGGKQLMGCERCLPERRHCDGQERLLQQRRSLEQQRMSLEQQWMSLEQRRSLEQQRRTRRRAQQVQLME